MKLHNQIMDLILSYCALYPHIKVDDLEAETVKHIQDRERRAFKAGQDSVCGRCGDLDCYHNKNPHSFEEYKKSEGYPK